MRLLVRSQTHAAPTSADIAAAVIAPATRATRLRTSGDERRAWIEALFGDHLPRNRSERDRAIDALVSDAGVWRMLHQSRHSMAETSATIERIARGAIEAEPLRAA